jgi:hypothetical protein
VYQVKVFEKATHKIIMESEIFSTRKNANELFRSIGSGENYYTIIFRLDAVWKDMLVKAIAV